MSDALITDVDRVVPFVCGRIGLEQSQLDEPAAVGLVRNGELIAGVLFEGYTGSCVELHVAGIGARWITKPMLRMTFLYPFYQLRCKVIRARVPSWNTASVKLCLRLGFKLEHIETDATPRGDMWVLAMRPADCRFLEV